MLKNKNKKAFEMKIQFNFGAVFRLKQIEVQNYFLSPSDSLRFPNQFEFCQQKATILSAERKQKRRTVGSRWEGKLSLYQYKHQERAGVACWFDWTSLFLPRLCRTNSPCSSRLLTHCSLNIWHVALYSSLLCLFSHIRGQTVAASNCFLIELRFNTIW